MNKYICINICKPVYAFVHIQNTISLGLYQPPGKTVYIYYDLRKPQKSLRNTEYEPARANVVIRLKLTHTQTHTYLLL